jgi:hypothetical protein
MADVTFCIPIAPRHAQVAQRAINSVLAQTIACDIRTLTDHTKQGPGVLRNHMLAGINTPFVIFLDADDYVDMTFAEETLAEYHRIGGNKYIFVDWIDSDGIIHETPCLNGANGNVISVPDKRPYCGGTWHPITTLIPTEFARAVGGFDETMEGAEDTDFYLKLCTTFRCGHRLARPLFHYTSGGGRAIDFRGSYVYDDTMQKMTIKYGGKMGCCGDDTPVPPIGEKQPGDVLAMAMWSGRRHQASYITNRVYPRCGYGETCWIDPRELQHRKGKNLWRLIEQPKPVDMREAVNNIQKLAGVAMRDIKPKGAPITPDVPEPPTPEVNIAPNIRRILEMTSKPDPIHDAVIEAITNPIGGYIEMPAVRTTRDPIFVFPDKDYPSYYDIKRLVELSGYKSSTFMMNTFDFTSRYIVISPEPIPEWLFKHPNVIAWQLEYAGDYTRNYDGFEGEVWASDKKWADEHNAKYVLMGSHPALSGDTLIPYHDRVYFSDITMLAYLTPRRQKILDKLNNYHWPVAYPGHGTAERHDVLSTTRLMLHVHQHDNAPYIAPQRFAIAAAYQLPMVSELVGEHVADAMDGWEHVMWTNYDNIVDTVDAYLNGRLGDGWAYRLHEHLCVANTFRKCVEKALEQ